MSVQLHGDLWLYPTHSLNCGCGPVVVAAADSPMAVKTAADYVCDGVDDQVEINAAIDWIANRRCCG